MPQNRQDITNLSSRRIKALKIAVLIIFGIILARLFFIQIIEHDGWVAKANQQHTLLETISAKRGEIYMMDKGEPVAVVLNQTNYQVVIDPTVTKKEDIEYVIKEYAKDYLTADIDKIYDTKGLRYAIIAKNVPRAVAEQIADSETPAIWLKKTNQRVYPEGSLASGLLGFVHDDGVGQYGVEGSLNKILAGKDGSIKTIADVNKVALSIGNDNVKIPAQNGSNVVLSIDRGLEQGVEDITASIVESSNATNASVLIMDPNTSKVLAMANLPNYDPNKYTEVTDISLFNNYVTDVPYEPASVCKSFAFSAAINDGVMSPDTTYFNEHYVLVDGWAIENATKLGSLYGDISMRTAFYWSLNSGSIQALRLLGGDASSINRQGRERLYDYYHNKFRLGQTTGIEIYEAEGYIEDPNEGWGRDSTYANMTFGQNLGITMLQTATAFSAVVNGGTWRTPSVVEGELVDGKIVPLESDKKVEDKILSDETSAAMRGLLVNNRDYKVTQGIDRPGYDIGGKTGTAQVVVNGAYDNTMSQLVGSYIGFIAPSGGMPEYVIMIKMWGDGQSIEGGNATGLFDELSNYIIDYMKIKPGVW